MLGFFWQRNVLTRSSAAGACSQGNDLHLVEVPLGSSAHAARVALEHWSFVVGSAFGVLIFSSCCAERIVQQLRTAGPGEEAEACTPISRSGRGSLFVH